MEIETGVDQLMNLVRDKKKLSVAEAAKLLNKPEDTVQKWVDFLVEELILGLEYKFTTPYIYVHSEERLQSAVKGEEEHFRLSDFKDVFYIHAREKEMPEDKIGHMWIEHLKYVISQQESFFHEECKRQGVPNPDELYPQYMKGVTGGA